MKSLFKKIFFFLFKEKKSIEIKPIEQPKQNKKMPRIAIVRGHGGRDMGAEGCGTSEVEYHTYVIDKIEEKNFENVKCFYADSSLNAIAKSILFNPDITIQLHLNSADSKQANGCEVLVLENDKKSFALAENLADEFTKTFNRKKRGENGKKLLSIKDRGAKSLLLSPGQKVLFEPFFISNKNDFLSREEFSAFLIAYIKKISNES